MISTPKRIPRSAAVLGYGGVIPFAALAMAFAFGPETVAQKALDGFLIYGAVILSFLGGIRWGAASAVADDHGWALVVAIAPSLWAAFFLWWPGPTGSAWGLLAGFVLMGLADWMHPSVRVPAWMRPLRLRLTVAVVLLHLPVVAVL